MRYFLRRPRAFWISVCNLVGLACSLAGVVLLLWFSVGPEIPGASTPLGAENGKEQLFQIESRRYGRNATIGPGRFWKQYLHSVLHGGAGDAESGANHGAAEAAPQ